MRLLALVILTVIAGLTTIGVFTKLAVFVLGMAVGVEIIRLSIKRTAKQHRNIVMFNILDDGDAFREAIPTTAWIKRSSLTGKLPYPCRCGSDDMNAQGVGIYAYLARHFCQDVTVNIDIT